jgi:hypothetical protein
MFGAVQGQSQETKLQADCQGNFTPIDVWSNGNRLIVFQIVALFFQFRKSQTAHILNLDQPAMTRVELLPVYTHPH